MQEQGATQTRRNSTAAPRRIRVAIVEDSPIIRTGLCAAISQSGLELAGDLLPGDATVQRIRALAPDVLLLGVGADPGGFRLLDAIREAIPDVAVVVINAQDRDFLLQAIDHGATSYLPITVSQSDLLAAVEAAVQDRTLLLRKDLARAVAPVARARPERPPEGGGLLSQLTRREQEVLSLLAQGCSTQEMARRLTVTQGTVKAHLSSIFRKLQVRSRVEAALVATAQAPGAAGPRPLEAAG